MWVAALVVLVVYARAAWLGLSWDDAPLTVDNPSLRSLEGLVRLWTQETWSASGLDEKTSYYRPVAMTSFWLVARVSNTAAAHHLTNVLLHALNGALVARVLLVRTRTTPLVACLFASFWALATASSEAVLWISGRFDVLATTFLLVAFLTNAGSRRWVVALSFACALLTKELALAWLPVLVVDDLALQGRGWRESWRRWAVAGALAIGYLAIRRAVGIATGESIAGALGWFVSAFASIAARVALKLFVPVALDPLQPLHVLPLVAVVALLALVASLLVFTARATMRSPAPASLPSIVLVGVVWFLVTLLPMAIIPPAEPVAGDRYGYAASLGLVLALAGGVAALGHPRAALISRVALGLLAAVHGVLTELRIPAWQDRASIAASMAKAHPESAHAHYLLGYLALERRDLDAADAELTKSLSLERTWRALDAACVLELRRGHLDLAEQDCLESAAQAPANPRVWVNLASVSVKRKEWKDGLERASRAIELKPRYAEGRYLAAVSAANLRMMPLAATHLEAGLLADPSHRGLLRLKEDMERRR